MPHKQNPTAAGRVLRNSFVGASKETLNALAYRAQYLFACTVRPETAVMLATFVFDGSGHRA